MCAVQEAHKEVVSLLLKAGAEVNIQEETGKTALMMAVKKGYFDIASELLRAGADPNIQDCDG